MKPIQILKLKQEFEQKIDTLSPRQILAFYKQLQTIDVQDVIGSTVYAQSFYADSLHEFGIVLN